MVDGAGARRHVRLHRHHHDHVIIWPGQGQSREQVLGSEDWLTQDAEAGFVLYKAVGSSRPMQPHRMRNVGTETTTHVIVELLEPSPHVEEEPWVHNGRGTFIRAGETDEIREE